jgi:hypothetical protein
LKKNTKKCHDKNGIAERINKKSFRGKKYKDKWG